MYFKITAKITKYGIERQFCEDHTRYIRNFEMYGSKKERRYYPYRALRKYMALHIYQDNYYNSVNTGE